jgi:hypothetical protein
MQIAALGSALEEASAARDDMSARAQVGGLVSSIEV